jgi:thioredoxin 1
MGRAFEGKRVVEQALVAGAERLCSAANGGPAGLPTVDADRSPCHSRVVASCLSHQGRQCRSGASMSHATPSKAAARFALAAMLALAVSMAEALTVVPYTAGAFAAAQKAGRPLVLHFHAEWCPTCRAQDKVFESLKADPALDVTLMQVDFDTEKALERQLNVSAQSTLLVFHGATERARVVGETDPAKLKELLRSAR